MRAEELRLEEVLTWSDGLLSLQGRRLVLHDIRAMAQFRRELVETAGPERAQRILTRYGFFWGQNAAAGMLRAFRWDSVEELLRACFRLQTVGGLAKATVQAVELPPGGGVRIEAVWEISAESEEHLAELGPSPEPACWILTGYASGYASFCLGRPVYFIETACRACGGGVCTILGQDEAAWGERAGEVAERFRPGDIREKIERLSAELASRERELRAERQRHKTLEPPAAAGLAPTRSKAFQGVLDLARRVAPFETPVLVTGESGVGKEIVARLIHTGSRRAKGPFVAVNCTAMPETLLESELFGHEKGAFTGAMQRRIGYFEHADGGTLFLDEIGELGMPVQAKLLRFLQEREFQRLGGNQTIPADVRIIAATNRDLEARVREGAFREDLFYRLQVVPIQIPPLRERGEDVITLARHFLEKACSQLSKNTLRLTPEVETLLRSYDWSGNVRELENVIERVAILADGDYLQDSDFPDYMRNPRQTTSVFETCYDIPESGVDFNLLVDQFESRLITMALNKTGGNKKAAARLLHLNRTTLVEKIKKKSLTEEIEVLVEPSARVEV